MVRESAAQTTPPVSPTLPRAAINKSNVKTTRNHHVSWQSNSMERQRNTTVVPSTVSQSGNPARASKTGVYAIARQFDDLAPVRDDTYGSSLTKPVVIHSQLPATNRTHHDQGFNSSAMHTRPDESIYEDILAENENQLNHIILTNNDSEDKDSGTNSREASLQAQAMDVIQALDDIVDNEPSGIPRNHLRHVKTDTKQNGSYSRNHVSQPPPGKYDVSD